MDFGQSLGGMQGALQAAVPIHRGRAGKCELAKCKEHRGECSRNHRVAVGGPVIQRLDILNCAGH